MCEEGSFTKCEKCAGGNAPFVRFREFIDGDYWCVQFKCLSCQTIYEKRYVMAGTITWKMKMENEHYK